MQEKFLTPEWIQLFKGNISSAPVLMVDANLSPPALEASCKSNLRYHFRFLIYPDSPFSLLYAISNIFCFVHLYFVLFIIYFQVLCSLSQWRQSLTFLCGLRLYQSQNPEELPQLPSM